MEEIAIEIIAQIFAIAAPLAAILWEIIVMTTSEIFWYWFTETLVSSIPDISENLVKLAFTVLSTITVATFVAVKKAWAALRRYLLELMIYFSKNSSSEWVKRSTVTLLKSFHLSKPVIVKREVEEKVDWDELPDDIRQQQIRLGRNNYQVNFCEIRDKEMGLLTMSN